jgi:hypothetical protein
MQAREKTETRTLRFKVSTLKRLKKVAEKKGVSDNEFVAIMLEERLFIDPLVPAFHGSILDSSTIDAFLMSGNVDVLEAVLSENAYRNVPLIFKLYETSEMPIDFWRYIVDILGNYCGWFYVEGNDAVAHKWIMLRHSYGLKWSRCLKSHIVGAYGAISKDKIQIEVSDQWIRIDFQPS